MFIVYIPRHQALVHSCQWHLKSVQPEMVGGGKKIIKLLKIFIFYLKNKKVKSFKYLIYRLTLASSLLSEKCETTWRIIWRFLHFLCLNIL